MSLVETVGATRLLVGAGVVVAFGIVLVAWPWIKRYGARVVSALRRGSSRAASGSSRVGSGLRSRRAKAVYAAVAILASVVGVLWLSVTLAGIVATVVYTILFVVALTFFPFVNALTGSSAPNVFGKLHVMLGAFAYNRHFLVQRDERWEWCPGTKGSVYVDGAYREIKGGVENWSVLGWRPFAVLRHKEEGTLTEVRADTVAERARRAVSDGGAIERGGFREASPPGVSGTDGTWLIDLKRVLTHGVKRFGDIELVETAEEVIERGELGTGMLEGRSTTVKVFMGLVFGLFTGYVMFVA